MFERIYIIALPHRRERTARLRERFPDAVVVNAFHGRDVAAPKWFRAGFGAWGCYVSHLHVLLAATHDKLASYLVLEDDALLIDDFERHLEMFAKHVPENWGQVYLGGCHQAAPEMLNEYIYACHSVDRTHAFGVSERAFKTMFTHLMEFELFQDKERPRHFDQVLQKAHEKCLWPVYAPTWWLAGQAGGISTITLQPEPPRWWHCPAYARVLPVILFADAPSVWHLDTCYFGSRANEDYEDWRFHEGIADRAKMIPFLLKLAQEALVYGKLPAIRTTKVSTADLHQLGFAAYRSCDDIAAIANYPNNNLINNGYFPKRTATR